MNKEKYRYKAMVKETDRWRDWERYKSGLLLYVQEVQFISLLALKSWSRLLGQTVERERERKNIIALMNKCAWSMKINSLMLYP